MQLGYFCNTKDQRGFISTLAFVASRRACRPTAVFSIQRIRNPHQTGEPRGLSPSGGLGDESAGNARPSAERFQSAMLLFTTLRATRAVRGAGALPLLVEFDDAGVLGDDLLLVVDKGGLGGLGKGGLLAVYQHFHFFHSGELGAGE